MGSYANDDFESYHDFNHLPGQILMAMRLVLPGYRRDDADAFECKRAAAQGLLTPQASYLGFGWFQSPPF
jgi:hypothetical protein